MSTALDRLQDQLNAAGANLLQQTGEGPFDQSTYRVDGMIVQLISEYGSLRANVGLDGHQLFPASFWITALAGSDVFPDPPVTDEDLAHLADRLPELVRKAPDLADIVVAMGEAYSRAMRQKLE